MGIYMCILFYCGSKLLTYLFLRKSSSSSVNAMLIYGPVEKVYIVWPNNGTRWSSTAYKIGFSALLGFLVVVVIIVLGWYPILHSLRPALLTNIIH
jgi:hypothetical protein